MDVEVNVSDQKESSEADSSISSTHDHPEDEVKDSKAEVSKAIVTLDEGKGEIVYNCEDIVKQPNVDNSPAVEIKSERMMETDTDNVDSSEPLTEEISSQETPSEASTLLSSDTSKSSEKRPRARATSESSSSPANKILKVTPRATRSSQNPDFAAKQRKFLNRVHDPIRNNTSDSENSQGSITPISAKLSKDGKSKSAERKSIGDTKKKLENGTGTPKRPAESEDDGSTKKRKTKEPTKVVGGVDSYCWRCHRDGNVIRCEICPRVYHLKCVQLDVAPAKGWMCPECSTITQAENTDTRSRAMRMLSLDQLCNLLRFALNRMKSYEGAEEFMKPVDVTTFPYYLDFIVKPMDLSQLERNIKAKMYGSTEAFSADAKWIVHNSIIFNSVQSKFTNTARSLLKICRQEMQEIENCPDCYQNAHTRSSDSWFIEACRRPHLLVWAKLKGFPFWPAKAMTTNMNENLVDVRFFGAHDRAWVPVNMCFLYSKLSPVPSSNKNKRNLEECLQELELHIKKLRDKFGQFEYAPYKTPFNPNNEEAQLSLILPLYEAKVPGKRGNRMSLHHDGARKLLPQKAQLTSADKTSAVKEIPSPKNSAAYKSSPKESPPTVMKTMVPPMVSFPRVNESKASPQKDIQRTVIDHTPPHKSGTSPSLKRSHKTPLTAAAKKCFATEEKSCFKCNTKTTMEWSVDSTGKSLCTSCTLSSPKSLTNDESVQHDKSCAKCHKRTSTVWHTAENGDRLCASCKPEDIPNVQIEKDDRAVKSSTMRGTVTVRRRQPEESIENEKTEVPLADTNNTMVAESSDVGPVNGGEPSTAQAVAGTHQVSTDDGANVQEKGDSEDRIQSASDDTSVQFTPLESPPKFVISKTTESPPETGKKASIVDRLQEKLCYVVEEVIGGLKDHNGIEETSSVQSEEEETSEPVLESSDNLTTTTQQATHAKVVLHDLKDDEEMREKIQSLEENLNKKLAESEIPATSPSDVCSEPETDGNSSLESDSVINDQESNKKKKQEHINNVVQTLKERKGSVDENSEPVNQSPKSKDTTALMLDDSNEEGTVLIIDEGSNSSEGKKSVSRSDKSRRKGIPAKVHSRTSTDSSDNSPESSKSRDRLLDEISGQFRRSSEELTINLVTDDVKLQKKKENESLSVNLSKSVSISVIKEPPATLEMECVEDHDEEVIFETSVNKAPPRPTARKTLPNSPKSTMSPPANITVHNKACEADLGKQRLAVETLIPPPPLLNLQQQKPKTVNSVMSQTPTMIKPVMTFAQLTPPRTDMGPATASLDEAVNKVTGQLRVAVEEVLRSMSETGCTEATVKALQMEMERLQFRHRQEIIELKSNTDLLLIEMRSTMEADKQRALLDAKHKLETEKEQAIQDTKRKQWCAFCQKEAQLHCCWNTAYCSYDCQQRHWIPHMNSCLNKQGAIVPDPPRPPPQRPNYMPGGQMHDDSAPSRRKRCGMCEGCTTQPCGQCTSCTNRNCHTVCKYRRCSVITKVSEPQRGVRQPMMPPPNNPPAYHASFRPNQMYAVPPGPRLNHLNQRPSMMYPMESILRGPM